MCTQGIPKPKDTVGILGLWMILFIHSFVHASEEIQFQNFLISFCPYFFTAYKLVHCLELFHMHLEPFGGHAYQANSCQLFVFFLIQAMSIASVLDLEPTFRTTPSSMLLNLILAGRCCQQSLGTMLL